MELRHIEVMAWSPAVVSGVLVVAGSSVPEAKGVVENSVCPAQSIEEAPVVHDLVDVVNVLDVVGAQV